MEVEVDTIITTSCPHPLSHEFPLLSCYGDLWQQGKKKSLPLDRCSRNQTLSGLTLPSASSSVRDWTVWRHSLGSYLKWGSSVVWVMLQHALGFKLQTDITEAIYSCPTHGPVVLSFKTPPPPPKKTTKNHKTNIFKYLLQGSACRETNIRVLLTSEKEIYGANVNLSCFWRVPPINFCSNLWPIASIKHPKKALPF